MPDLARRPWRAQGLRCRPVWMWVWTGLLGLVAGPSALAEPGRVELSDLAAGTEWIAWQDQGLLQVPAPPDWELEGTPEDPLKVQLVGGELIALPPEATLHAEGLPMLAFQAGFARASLDRHGLTLTVMAQRVLLPGGAMITADRDGFGSDGARMVTAIYVPRRREFSLHYRDALALRVDRLELASPADEPATVETLALPGVSPVPATLRRLGLWSPAGVLLRSEARALSAQTETVGWAEVDGVVARTEPVRIEAPQATVRLRRATWRASSRVTLPCRLVEPSGLMAEDVRLTVSGAPDVVAFAAEDSPEGLEQALEALSEQRAGGPGRGADPLVSNIRAYLLPYWYGLWYDAATGREDVRSPATLRTFVETYRAAQEASRAGLREWLDRPDHGAVSLADPEAFRAALGELVETVSRADQRATAWWSVYLSDLLSDQAGAAISYWYGTGDLQSAAADPGAVTLAGLARGLERRDSGVLRACKAAVAAGDRLETLSFARLAPGANLPLEIEIEVGRGTPVGTWQATLELSGAGTAKVPLTVVVNPSYGEIGLLALMILLPAALALAAARLLLQKGRRPRG